MCAARRLSILETTRRGQHPGRDRVRPGAEMATPGRRRQQVVLGAFTALLQDGDPDLRLAAAFVTGAIARPAGAFRRCG